MSAKPKLSRKVIWDGNRLVFEVPAAALCVRTVFAAWQKGVATIVKERSVTLSSFSHTPITTLLSGHVEKDLTISCFGAAF